jgi:hypothetical protein
VDAEYTDRRLKKESFEMTWRFEEADEVSGCEQKSECGYDG